MRSVGIFQWVIVALAMVGTCLPSSVLAASTAENSAPRVADVALAADGVLTGQVVGPQGAAIPKATVSLMHGRDRQVAVAQTDARGFFSVSGLRGGVYQAVSADADTTFRLWTSRHAPPHAKTGILLTSGRKTVRGQCLGGACFWMSNPWVITGAAAAAIAVPVAVHNSRRPCSP